MNNHTNKQKRRVSRAKRRRKAQAQQQRLGDRMMRHARFIVWYRSINSITAVLGAILATQEFHVGYVGIVSGLLGCWLSFTTFLTPATENTRARKILRIAVKHGIVWQGIVAVAVCSISAIFFSILIKT